MVSALHPTEIRLLPIPTCCRPPLGLSSSVSLSTTSTTHHPIPFYTDPSRMDTDEDGVTDYIELQGWDVIVIHERRGEVMEDLCKYGVWSLPVRFDSEGDGASDETEWKFHGNPDSSDSDKDGIPDREESGPNLTMVEGTPPVILDKKGRDKSSEKYSGAYIKTKVKIKTKWSISGVKIKGKIIVIFTVVDNAGLDRAVIYVQTGGERIIYLGRDKRREIEEVFEIGDLLRLIHGGYDIRVNVTDINGNWATGKTHIDSALQTLKKGLSALLEILKAVARIIAKVASMLLEVIKKIISKMLNPIFEPIKNAVYDWQIALKGQISLYLSHSIENSSKNSRRSIWDDLKEENWKAQIFGTLYIMLFTMTVILQAINVLVTALGAPSGLAALEWYIQNAITTALIPMFVTAGTLTIIFSIIENDVDETTENLLTYLDNKYVRITALISSFLSMLAEVIKAFVGKSTSGLKSAFGFTLALLGFFIVYFDPSEIVFKLVGLIFILFGLMFIVYDYIGKIMYTIIYNVEFVISSSLFLLGLSDLLVSSCG